MKTGTQTEHGAAQWLHEQTRANWFFLENAVCAILSFVMANAFLYGTMAPFGVSFTAAVKREHTLAAAAGAVLGYTFSYNPTNNMKYIIAVVLLLAAKWVLADTALNKHRFLVMPLIALFSVLVSGLAVVTVGVWGVYSLVLSISEGILAAGTSFFMMRSMELGDRRENMFLLSRSDLSCLVITFAIAMMALGTFTVAGLSVGRVFSVVVILLAAKYGQEAAGAVAGVTAGAAMGLLGSSFTFLAAAYGFGGMVAGMFSTFGSFGCAVIFVVINAVVSFLLGGEHEVSTNLYEVFAASVLFVLLPGRFTDKLFLARRNKTQALARTAKEIIQSKLHFAAQALSDIALTTSHVSEKLDEMRGADLGAIYNKSVESVCGACERRSACWAGNFAQGMESLNHLTTRLRRCGQVQVQDLSGYLAQGCTRQQELIQAVNTQYGHYAQKQGNRRRLTQIRGVVTDQFEGMSMMLASLSGELSEIYEVDERKNRCIAEVFAQKKTELLSSASYEDCDGRLFVELCIPAFKLARLPLLEVTAELSDVCETDFGLPAVQQADGTVRLCFTERANLQTEFGKAQIPYGESKLCGDCCDFLLDARGRAHLILSDGMGSGGKAAIDAAMTVSLLSKLIAAGFAFDAALRLVNSALLVKSSEESLSTIDVSCVNLYTGEAQFLKAGAAPTFLYRSGTVGKVEAMSMPAGILRGVQFETSAMKLHAGDTIVMISDGVLLTGMDWLYPEIKLCKDLSAQELADEIAKTAKIRRTDSHDDDITVAVLKLLQGA